MNITYFKKHLLANTTLLLLILINSLSVFASIEQKHYQYDLNSNITQQITAKGAQIDYSYDSLNQLIQVNSSDGANVHYSYDSEGRITSMQDATGTSLYQYDTLGRLTAYQQAGANPFYYYYNALNQLTSFKDPLGNWTYYQYNPDGRLTTSYDFNGYNSYNSYQYHAITGLLLRHIRYAKTDTPGNYSFNGYTDYSYNAARRLVQVSQINQNSQHKAITVYSYDGNGNRTQIIRQIPGQTEYASYQYDGLNRLTQVSYQGGARHGQAESYVYDAGGNRLSKASNNGSTYYEYSSDNRLLKTTRPQGVTDYAYDGGGNLITKTEPGNTTHYQYDSRNLLIGYQDTHQQVSYQYNGAGHRVAKTVNGVTTRYINHINFGLSQVALETDENYSVKRHYSYGLGRTAAYDWQASWQDQSQYYRYDRPRRNVTATEDRWGNTRNRYQYGSFGENFSSLENHSNHFRYAGEQTESDSGLIYLRARYYDPEIGRFISRDPFSGYMAVPESQNMYAYAHNNPVRFVDPSGECVETPWDILNVIYDVGKIAYGYISGNQNTVSEGYVDLGADSLAVLIPGLPAGITKLRYADDVAKGVRPPNLSPLGAGRKGAFKEAKRQSGIPASQQPSRVLPNLDKRGKVQPGKVYEFDIPASGGGTKAVRIRNDAGGHNFGAGNSQNRGPHFNDEAGNHFDY